MGLLNFQVRVHIHGQVNLRSCNNINIKSGNETTATATTPTEKNMTGNNVSNKQSFRRHNVEGNKNERHSYTKYWNEIVFFYLALFMLLLLSFLTRIVLEEAAQYLSAYFFQHLSSIFRCVLHAYVFIMHLNSAQSSFNLIDAVRPWTGDTKFSNIILFNVVM